MSTLQLTPATAKELPPGKSLRDHEVKGLQLIAGTQGKSWHLYYRTREGKERRPKIGSWPEMPLSRARAVAKDLKERIAAGEDPSAAWKQERDAPTVADLCDRYLSEWAPRHNTPRTLKEKQLLIDCHIKPGLGNRKVAEVTRAMVDRFLDDVLNRRYIPAERKAQDRVAKAPGAANHVRTLLAHLFSLARSDFGMAIQKIDGESVNPVHKTVRHRIDKRKRRAEPTELAALLQELDRLEPDYPVHVACLWTLFFTGGRVSEVLHAKKSQLRGDTLVLSEHKTMKHIGEKTVQLPGIVVERLAKLDVKGERLFGDIALKSIWKQIRVAANCPGLQLRDARRTFASYALSGAGLGLDVTGKLLGHTDPRTTSGYAYLLDNHSRQMVDNIAETMIAAAGRK